MTGEELRQKLQNYNIPLRQVAIAMGITEQDFQSKLKAKDLKVSFVMSVAKAINKSVYCLIEDEQPNVQTKKSVVQIIHHPKVSEKLIQQQSIPLYNIEAAANLKTIFENKEQNILGEISIPNIPRCDGALYVRGDSMYPLLKSGDIIGYKEIYDFENVIFGEMYMVAYDIEGDEFVTVKYVNHSEKEGCIKLVSYNTHHDPRDIQLQRISAMALIKFSIRMNTIL